jgi:TonB family protein
MFERVLLEYKENRFSRILMSLAGHGCLLAIFLIIPMIVAPKKITFISERYGPVFYLSPPLLVAEEATDGGEAAPAPASPAPAEPVEPTETDFVAPAEIPEEILEIVPNDDAAESADESAGGSGISDSVGEGGDGEGASDGTLGGEGQADSGSDGTGLPGAEDGVEGGTGDKEEYVELRVSSGLTDARLILRVIPIYPNPARRGGIQGTVVIRAVIGIDGRLNDIQSTGHELLVPAAEEAIRRWRYIPHHLNGEPIETNTTISVRFVLR